MAGTRLYNSILVIDIILALVMITGKQNSAPGHAHTANTAPGSRRRYW